MPQKTCCEHSVHFYHSRVSLPRPRSLAQRLLELPVGEYEAQRFDDLVRRGRVGVEAAQHGRVLAAVGSNFSR